jgi:hypothetical protein
MIFGNLMAKNGLGYQDPTNQIHKVYTEKRAFQTLTMFLEEEKQMHFGWITLEICGYSVDLDILMAVLLVIDPFELYEAMNNHTYHPGYLNDLWKFDRNYWTWMSGSYDINQIGNYGEQGIPSEYNIPPSKTSALCWIDLHGNLWLFGGLTSGKIK